MNDTLLFDKSLSTMFGGVDATPADKADFLAYDADSIFFLLCSFGFHMLVCFFIVHFCYYRKAKNREYYKSFMFFAAGMFLLLFLLESVKIYIGLTLGLFAIFGVIRYRTETVPIREMTYLFMIIVISVINGLSLNISYLELGLANLLLIGIICMFEYQKVFSTTYSKLILYDRIDLITPEQRENMIEDLKKRTGLNIIGVEVGCIDFLKDSAFVKIFYHSDTYESNTIGHITKLK